MYLIGLTGNIASGKSTVRRTLQELGARTIDADLISHEVLEPETQGWHEVVARFGPDILNPDGTVDRARLGALVFSDPAALRDLEAIVHPAVARELGRLLAEAREEIVVVEAVKLIEAGLNRFCDAVWIVTTTPEEAERRLMQDRGLSREQARLRLAAQPPLGDKPGTATLAIDNSGPVEATQARVRQAYAAIDPSRATDKRQAIRSLLDEESSPSQ